jgi:hypothetical protein
MSFAIILTLVIMTQTAPDHLPNDLLSTEEENDLPSYSERLFINPAKMSIRLSKLAHLLVRRIE